jgi:hypothetical protein
VTGSGKWFLTTASAILVGVATPLLVGALSSRGSAPISSKPFRLTVQVDDTVDTNIHGQSWWVPESVSGTKIPLNTLESLLQRYHAVDEGDTWIKITLVGASPQTVVITDIRAKILSRTSLPRGGTFMNMPVQGGSDDLSLGIDLDSPVPSARDWYAYHVFYSDSYFQKHSITLRDGEAFTGDIEVATGTADVSYELVIDAVVNGTLTHTTVLDGSRPFRTIAFGGHYAKMFGWDPSIPQYGLLPRSAKQCNCSNWSISVSPHPTLPGAL